MERLQNAAREEPDVIDATPNENNEQQPNESENGNAENNRVNASETPANVTTDTSSTSSPSSTQPTSGEQDENNRLPTVTLLRTFILSFFSSLIPETPAV